MTNDGSEVIEARESSCLSRDCSPCFRHNDFRIPWFKFENLFNCIDQSRTSLIQALVFELRNMWFCKEVDNKQLPDFAGFRLPEAHALSSWTLT
jgi:hypothetical protein